MHQNYYEGFIEVITGPMFAGKTEELIRRLKRLEFAKAKIQAFKPSIDNRYDDVSIASHAGTKVSSIPIDKAEEIWDHIDDDTQVVVIDEVQFFSDAVIIVCEKLADKGIRVIVAGLDQDFKGEPFGVMPELMTRAEFITKLTSICVCCGAPATRTQRLVDDKPAKYDDAIVLVGATEAYEPRCRVCHIVEGKPY